MNNKNIVALCLGVIVSGLLWQYYLKPKYDIKTGDAATELALFNADIAALEDATAAIEGQVLLKTSDSLITEQQPQSPDIFEDDSAAKADVLSTRNRDASAFDFASTANNPRDLYQLAADGDKRKETKIRMESDAVIVHPTMITPEVAPIADTSAPDSAKSEDAPATDKERFTMFLLPVEHKTIKTLKDYNKYKQDNPAIYPSVNFKKQMLIALEARGGLANSFLQIVNNKEEDGKILIDYRVNIIGASDSHVAAPVVVLPQTNKTIILKQVK